MAQTAKQEMIQATGDVSQYLSIIRAAERIGVTRSALYQAVEAGRLTLYSVNGKGVLKIADVDAIEPVRPDQKAGRRLKTWQAGPQATEVQTSAATGRTPRKKVQK